MCHKVVRWGDRFDIEFLGRSKKWLSGQTIARIRCRGRRGSFLWVEANTGSQLQPQRPRLPLKALYAGRADIRPTPRESACEDGQSSELMAWLRRVFPSRARAALVLPNPEARQQAFLQRVGQGCGGTLR